MKIRSLNIDNIPAELKDYDQWVCWKAKLKADGKIDKIPIIPGSGRNAKSNDPKTWRSYDEAVSYLNTRSGVVSGIGFALSKDDPFVGGDLDHCRNPETGELTDDAKKLLETFNTYSEISPSDTGVRFFCRGELPGKGATKDGVELYDQGRYLTITGGWLSDYSGRIEDRPHETVELHKRLSGGNGNGDGQFNPPGWQDELIPGVGESERHRTALRLAGRWKSKGHSAAEITHFIITWNQRNRPPKESLSDPNSQELKDIVSYKQVPGEPPLQDAQEEQQFNDYPPLMPEDTAVDITEAPAPPDAIVTYRDNPLLTRGIVGGVMAQGGTGKTFFLQQLAYKLAGGMGLGPLKSADTDGFQVLMLCGEDPQDEVERRLWAISGDGTYFPDNLHIASTVGHLGPLMRLENNNPVKGPAFFWLRETIQNHDGLDLLILDPKSRFYGLDENNNDHGTQWISALESLAQEFNITILFTHHISKASKTLDQNMSRGASAIVDGCRWVAGMTALSEAAADRYGIEDPRGYVVFDVTKTNYAAGLQSKIVFKRTENGTLEYAALESERMTMLLSILYDAIEKDPLKYSKRDFAKNPKGVVDDILETIQNQFPNFKQKEFPGLIDAMISGVILEEKKIETGGKGARKSGLNTIPIDPMNLVQIRF
jgi:hypothetical protein